LKGYLIDFAPLELYVLLQERKKEDGRCGERENRRVI